MSAAAAADPGVRARAVRAAAGLFRLDDRGLIEVRGGDRTRWLNGMLSNDVAVLEPGSSRSGCYALLLTPKGSIVADLHVLLREEAFWLETSAAATPGVIERLERYVVADDVELEDVSARWGRLGLEGPAAAAILARAGSSDPGALAPETWLATQLAKRPVSLAAFGWSGEPAWQIFVAREDEPSVARGLAAAGAELGLVEADGEVLEVLRVEAGVPRLGSELAEDVLPDEARLERAISTRKGCYTGQEIIARLRSRGAVNHLLVGLEFDGMLPPVGQSLEAQDRPGRPAGEVTSVAHSALAGAIGLGFVRREYAEPGVSLAAGSRTARVHALPFVAPGVTTA